MRFLWSGVAVAAYTLIGVAVASAYFDYWNCMYPKTLHNNGLMAMVSGVLWPVVLTMDGALVSVPDANRCLYMKPKGDAP